jgi:hypothetical protein
MAALSNEERSDYISKAGIILVEEGRYALNFDDIRLSSGYDYDKINVEIYHNLTTEKPQVTEFTVVEN